MFLQHLLYIYIHEISDWFNTIQILQLLIYKNIKHVFIIIETFINITTWP